MSLENTVTGGFGWKHALVIIGLSLVGAAVYNANVLGLGGIANTLVSPIKNITG